MNIKWLDVIIFENDLKENIIDRWNILVIDLEKCYIKYTPINRNSSNNTRPISACNIIYNNEYILSSTPTPNE